MALEGDLGEFPLTDIIQLVDLSKKTGGVEVHGQRSGQQFDGWLYFRDGKIVGAELPGHTPLEAVYTFFTLASGPFRFHDNRILSQPTITVSNEVVIMEGIMRQDAWASIQQHVPSLGLVPRLVPNPSSGSTEINLEAEEWRILTMVDGRNTISQLLQNGLIENRTISPGETLAPEFERIATGLLGTGASGVLQDAYRQASVFDPSRATGDQMLAVVDFFEMRVTPIVGAARASQTARELRTRTHEVLG